MKKIILLAGLFLSACQIIPNQPPLRTNLPPMSMSKADLNKDGSLDPGEFNQRLETLFEQRDVNDDDGLTPSELPKVNPDAFEHADQDNSGRLSPKEYQILRNLDFRRLDTDDDNVLVPHELFRW